MRETLSRKRQGGEGIRRCLVIALLAVVAAGAAVLAGGTPARTLPVAAAAPAKTCGSGYVHASLSWGEKCLRAGEACKVGNVEYHQYGFDCPASGHLASSTKPTPAPSTATSAPRTATPTVRLGRTVLLRRRTRTRACKLGPLPDRRCSPGAYYSGLTKAVICAAGFHTGTIRHVTESDRFAVEREYALAARHYGRRLEIDHIVSLELGGSNKIANLYPEEAAFSGHAPGYHVKDKLENKLHALVCSGAMSLRAAQRAIATNWEKLYGRVFGTAPTG